MSTQEAIDAQQEIAALYTADHAKRQAEIVACEAALDEKRLQHQQAVLHVAVAVEADPLLQEFVETFTRTGGRPSRGCPMHEIGPLAVTLFGPLSARPSVEESPQLAPRLLVNMALGDLARDQDCTTRMCTGTHQDPRLEGIRVWDLPGAGPQGRATILQASRLLHGGDVQDGLALLALTFPALRFALTFRFAVDPRRLFEPVFAQGDGVAQDGEAQEAAPLQEAALALDLARRFWLLPGVASGRTQ